MAKNEKPAKPKKQKKRRIAQLRQSYTMTKRSDPRIGLVLLAWFVVGAVLGAAPMLLLRAWLPFVIISSLLAGTLAALIVFGRRAQRSAFTQMEGQPGAAAAALTMLRRGWKTDPAVAFNRNQDVVHRVVGPPGIVLVGEGNPNRLRSLMANERRKHERVVSETPIQEVIVGTKDGPEGTVPLARLVKHLSKQKRALRPAEMTEVLSRLKALDANRSNIPLPKGPIPTNLKGARQQNMRGR